MEEEKASNLLLPCTLKYFLRVLNKNSKAIKEIIKKLAKDY